MHNCDQAAALIDEGFLQHLAPVHLLEEYWEHTLKDYPGHLLSGQPEKWKRAVPICLWGDEGTVGKSSWMISSWKLGFKCLQTLLPSLSPLYTTIATHVRGQVYCLWVEPFLCPASLA